MKKLLIIISIIFLSTQAHSEQTFGNAIETGDLKHVKYVLEQGYNINYKYFYIGTALHLAALNNQVEIARYLIEHGADLEIHGKGGKTPLHISIEYGYIEIFKFFISKSANIHAKDKNGNTALLYSGTGLIRFPENAKPILEILLTNGANIKDINKNKQNITILSANKDLNFLKYAISNGATLNQKDINGNTAILNAIKYGKIENVKYLISKGEKLDVKNNKGETPLITIAKYQPGGMYACCIVVDGKEVGIDRLGNPEDYYLKTADFLIQKTKNVDEKDNIGRTALSAAVFYGDREIIKRLLNAGASVVYTDKDGNTFLHDTSMHFSPELITLFIKKGLNVNAKNNKGETPIFSIIGMVKNKHKFMAVKLLLDAKADINAQDNKGNTILMNACKRCDLEFIKFLVENGTDVTLKNKQKQSAMEIAKDKCKMDIARYLYDVEKKK